MQRITRHPDLCHGRPTTRGLRVTVADVLELVASGMSREDILADYPYPQREDITACLEFAGRLVQHEV